MMRDDSFAFYVCTETNPHYFVEDDGTLVIFNSDPADSATYVCSATNDVGSDTRPMTLYVRSTCIHVPVGTSASQRHKSLIILISCQRLMTRQLYKREPYMYKIFLLGLFFAHLG